MGVGVAMRTFHFELQVRAPARGTQLCAQQQQPLAGRVCCALTFARRHTQGGRRGLGVIMNFVQLQTVQAGALVFTA